MLTALLSLYASTKLMGAMLPGNTVDAWNSNTLLEATDVPEHDAANIAPVIKAKSVIAVDLKNGMLLYEQNGYDHRPIASITKLMTTVIILEENNLNDVVTVPKEATQVDGSKIWLAQDEKITVENLLYAALIPSANDAAYTLAYYNSGGNVQDFVDKMNQKAEELGMHDTHFSNPIGLDEAGNYSSAYDLAILGRYAYQKSFIRHAVVIKEMNISSTNGKLTHDLKSTNDLLGSYLKVLGLKTGTTDLAGQCLIAIIENTKGNDILTVVLDSPSRYDETKLLADWIFRTFNWS
jgi:D-alanyl-D-alanine carboxypeptidase